MPSLTVIGAGGFGRETLDVIDALTAKSAAPPTIHVVDDNPRRLDIDRLRQRGAQYFGTVSNWLAETDSNAEYVIAIGSPQARRAVASRIGGTARPAPPLVHPTATVGSMARLGPGTILCAGVQISTNVHTGSHVHINPGAIVGHDCRLGHFVSVNPGAIISGDVNVNDNVLVGAGATILQGLVLGDSVTVGAAACVTRNVPSMQTVKGIPAR